ncbi:MAG: ABC transporter ATP-binding protein [Planctomycetota bacterium]|nr:ABC transporter ATP-binding protein [Planctomycetota bacterium]
MNTSQDLVNRDAAPAIEARGLMRRFGSHVAVSGIDLSIPRGCTYGFIGLNGAGKSTTIRMLTGLLPPSAGQALLMGKDVWKERTRAVSTLGYVPDRPNMYPWMRVGQAIEFASALWPSWDASLAAKLLHRYRLRSSQKIGKLSKGEGAKLSLLLALAHDPQILILDEPTDGLDVVARDDFLEEVLESIADQDRQRTVLISSHSLSDLQRLTDMVGVIHEGSMLLQGSTEELVGSTKRVSVVLEQPSTPMPPSPPGTILTRRRGREAVYTLRPCTADAITRLRQSAGVLDATVHDLSLDEIFKDLVRGQDPSRLDARGTASPLSPQETAA